MLLTGDLLVLLIKNFVYMVVEHKIFYT